MISVLLVAMLAYTTEKRTNSKEKVEQEGNHMRQGAGTPYPRNPEAMPRAAAFLNKLCLL